MVKDAQDLKEVTAERYFKTWAGSIYQVSLA